MLGSRPVAASSRMKPVLSRQNSTGVKTDVTLAISKRIARLMP